MWGTSGPARLSNANSAGAPRVFAALGAPVSASLPTAPGIEPQSPCDAPAAAAENCLPGDPASEWDVPGAGDPRLQGFATDISVNKGESVHFKIVSDGAFTIDIYRLGYYQGFGARKVATIPATGTLPLQPQPACLRDTSTGLTDCGNWSVLKDASGAEVSWSTTGATSGIYIAKLNRFGAPGASHIPVIVRDDARQADVVVQTSDTTWQAYNSYGGANLYCGGPLSNAGTAYSGCQGRAAKVSYNRPFINRGPTPQSYLFSAEYPMVRFLEANGYDVKYISGVDTDRHAGGLVGVKKPKVFVSSGHDEYWSGGQRASVEAARNAGVNLAFFSGNEIYWKTRYGPSIDGSNTPYRTLITYKETLAGAKIDPAVDEAGQPIWTGTWRDQRFSPPGDGGRPENGLTGTIWTVVGTRSITVPAAMKSFRFWRNTRVADLTSGIANLSPESLGYEWDEALNNGARPAGLVRLSSTTVPGAVKIIDEGATVGIGPATHNLTLYRHASGALVFGAGTIQWSWGLDSEHDGGGPAAHVPDHAMQQATVNLLADMGAQPATLQATLTAATASLDTVAPSSTIVSPVAGATVEQGDDVVISGTATDVEGVVAGVEVSVDDGATWHAATGGATWTYVWTPSGAGTALIKSRAADDSGNVETPLAAISVNVPVKTCPCGIWGAATVPPSGQADDLKPIEVGVKFRSDVVGRISGLRFYKRPANTGTHTGHLWSSTGTLLATATFNSANETASGWQLANFPVPVVISPNTTYVASYHTTSGGYAGSPGYFSESGHDNAPLHALRNGVDGPNGVFRYGEGGFPTDSFGAANYWVDVVFSPADDTRQVITFNPLPNKAVGDAPFAVNASASSGLPVSFSVVAGPATIAGNIVTLTGEVGTVTIRASQPGDASDAPAADVDRSFAVKLNQTITFGPLPNKTVGDAPFAVSATASSGLPVSFSVVSGPATISGGTVTLTGGAGTVVVRASQAGDASYAPAVAVDQAFAVAGTVQICPCSIWAPGTTPPSSANDLNPIEVGVRFRADVDGSITGLRFYKRTVNTGTHTGHLWSRTGTLLATATFDSATETAEGWQQVSFPTAVPITANTTYVASYHTTSGGFAGTPGYFSTLGRHNPPLHALANGVDGPNGVFRYGASGFPTESIGAANYWVDVVFSPAATTSQSITFNPLTDKTVGDAPFAVSATASSGLPVSFAIVSGPATIAGSMVTLTGDVGTVTVRASQPGNATYSAAADVDRSFVVKSTQTITFGPLLNKTAGAAPFAVSATATSGLPVSFSIVSGPARITGNVVTLTGGAGTVTVRASQAGDASYAPALFVDQAFTVAGPVQVCPCSLWTPETTPPSSSVDPSAIEVGVRFRADVDGYITGLRFYKRMENTGTHIGNLWSGTGTLLATAVFNGATETDEGWQQVSFPTAVPITANTTYVASYHTTSGGYAASPGYFSTSGHDNAPLHALRNGGDGPNGVFRYGVTRFPTDSFGAANYWVDVVFETALANDPPTISDVPDTTTPEDTPTSALSFTVGDAETPAAGLTVTATSSNATLVPVANIVFGGSDALRTVTITPALNQSGTATSPITVTDADGGTASDTVVLTVTAANDLPTISDIADHDHPGGHADVRAQLHGRRRGNTGRCADRHRDLLERDARADRQHRLRRQ